MKFLYNVHTLLGRTFRMDTYTSKGLVIGRPRPMGNRSIDDLEKDGWAGVYDPHCIDLNQNLQCSGSITVNVDPWQALHDQVKETIKEPESTLDDRIKEVRRDLKNPAKYRARWAGTRYVYDRIDE